MNQKVNGLKEGYWQFYHSNSKLYAKGNYKSDKKEGYWEWYHSNGNLWYKGNYKSDLREGYCEEYNSMLKLKIQKIHI